MALKLGLQNCVQLKLIVFQVLGLDFPDRRKVFSKDSFYSSSGLVNIVNIVNIDYRAVLILM